MSKLTRLLILLALAALLAACGSDDSSEEMAEMENMADTEEMAEMEDTEEMAEMEDMEMSAGPADLDVSTEKMTDNGLFMAAVSTEMDPLVLNEIHSWTLHLETPDGEPVEGATVGVGGGMPEHNHGFPTDPEVTQDLGGGDYLIEGVKFSMGGWWELTLNVEADGQSDSVTFNLVLP